MRRRDLLADLDADMTLFNAEREAADAAGIYEWAAAGHSHNPGVLGCMLLRVDEHMEAALQRLVRAQRALRARDAMILEGPLPSLEGVTFCGHPIVTGADTTEWWWPGKESPDATP